ncbi:LysR family transcriptional regulator [Thalassotalea euphylliae]|uniref:LysR family transcriptional regulator n=1 Tax=Thalassotalea euphylliae TaxID=1655234 RepID=UPI00363C3FA2
MERAHKKLERLVLFGEVAKHLNFSVAATQLGISKGYLSAQIKQLEQDLGTPLLIRTTRHVRLTPSGEDIATKLVDIHSAMLAIERHAQAEQEDVSGKVRITAPKQFASSILAAICQAFVKEYPEVHFDIDSSYTRYDLTADNFDLAFRATKQPPENMIATKITSYEYLCCAAPQYLSKYGIPTNVSELSEHQCLSTLGQHTWQLAGQQVEITGWLKGNDNHALKQHAIDGFGLVQLPDYFIGEDIKRGKLVEVLTQYRQQGLDIYLLQPQLIRPPKRVIAFRQFVLAFMDHKSDLQP